MVTYTKCSFLNHFIIQSADMFIRALGFVLVVGAAPENVNGSYKLISTSGSCTLHPIAKAVSFNSSIQITPQVKIRASLMATTAACYYTR